MFLACCYNDDMLIDPDTIYPTHLDCQDAPKSRFKPQTHNLLFLNLFFCLHYYSHLDTYVVQLEHEWVHMRLKAHVGVTV